MKDIDTLSDRNQGHYVVPKAPNSSNDEQMRRIIIQMKQDNKQNKVK